MLRGSRRKLLLGTVLALAAVAAGTIAAQAVGGAPTVEIEHPTSLGRTSVVLNAFVNPNGSPVSECVFEYGTSEGSLTSTAPCSYSPGELETPVPVNATVEGLAETTTYFFRIHAKSAAGESTSSVRELTTLPTVAYANTEQPAAVGHTTATLSGFVNPDDAEVTECFFEYGTVPGELSNHAACSPAPGSGGEPVQVQASIGGLAESTVVYYRLVATNSFGTGRGGRTNFETLPSHPRANTEPAIAVAHTSAMLRGFVTPNGAAIEDCHFEWGAVSVEEHTTPCEQTELGSGEAPVAVSAALTGLAESTNYHFRLLATNVHGTAVGGGAQFTTLPYLAKLLNQRPVELSDTTALLRGKVDPQGQTVTECRFEYGTTPALGKSVPCGSLPGGGEEFVSVSARATGLSPTTTYLERVRVVNASGANYSHEETFTTFEAGLLPVVSGIKPKKGSPAGGNTVTIKGQNLEGATSVRFGEYSTTNITSDNPDVMTVVAPPGAGASLDVIVTTESGESALGGPGKYTYTNPMVSTVTPGNGPVAGGTEVTVTGNGFEPGSTGTTILFGKVPGTDVECSSNTTCTVVSPHAAKGKGTVKLSVRVNGKGSKSANSGHFIYE